jgi:hypothetical protein
MSTPDIIMDCLKNDPYDPDKRKKCIDDFIQDGCNAVNKYYDIFKSKLTPDQYNSIKQQLIDYSKNFNENNDALTTVYITKTNCTINALNRIFELTGDQALNPINMQTVLTKVGSIKENYKNNLKVDDPKNPPDNKKTIMNIVLILGLVAVLIFMFLEIKK